MNRQLVFLLVGLGLILSSCSLAPKYTQPAAPIPQQLPQGDAYQQSQTASAAVNITELSWNDFFADEQLQTIISMALENNRDLRLAALNVERARAMYGIQKAELFPAINAAGGGGKQYRSADLISPGDPRTVEQYGVNLGIVAWEIDFFGRIRSLNDRALEAYLATDEAQRGAQIALIAEVARAYLTLAADQENQQLAQSTLENQQEAYQLVQNLFDAGLSTELDLRRAQIPVEVAKGDVARIMRLVAQDKNALNLLAGSSVAEELLPEDLSSVIPPQELAAGLSSAVLLLRPDIVAAEHRLKGAYAFIGAARAAFFPRISLTTTIGTASNELSGLFGSGTDTWNFAPQVAMPIFDARTWAAYRVSKADREIVLTQYEKTIQTAFREVADTLAVQGTIDQQVMAQQSLVNAATETHSLSKERYDQGIDNYLGVLVAQQFQFAVEQGLVALQLAKLANRVKLYAVLGGGSSR